jgi:hypothetical protein
MTTELHSTLKRALKIKGRDYVVTLTTDHLKLTLKGKRNGIDLAWADLVDGDAALAIALRASVGAINTPPSTAIRQPARNVRTRPKPKRISRR